MYVQFLSGEKVEISHCKRGENMSVGLPICSNSTSGFKIYLEKDCETLLYDYSDFISIATPYNGAYTYFGNPSLLPASEQTLTPEMIAERERADNVFCLNNQIRALKEELEASDYKVIKCYEFALVGETCADYDLQALHTERQTIRDTINRLQNELNSL